MEQTRYVSFRTRSIQFFFAVGVVVALLSAGAVLPAGAQNTPLGTGALSSNTTGTNDTALGFDALLSNTTGNDNTATGFEALDSNTTGNFNTATGSDALLSNTEGVQNTATGFEALKSNTTGADNTATGMDALLVNSTGNFNTATGFGALTPNATGSDNTATGFGALASNVTGGDNTVAGFQALQNNTSGNNNIAVGSNAGNALTTGSHNIDIGNSGVAGESTTIRIGTKGTQIRTFIAGIGNSHVFGSPVMVNGSGRLGILVSSARFKRDIHDMGDTSGKLMKLRPVTFRYKEDAAGALQYGLIAEEVERVCPELVTYGADGRVEAVAYHLLPAMLLNEMQKQARENRQKDARIAALQQQIVAQHIQIVSQQQQIGAMQKETVRIDTLTARLNALEEQARRARPERLAAATR